jgi:3-dehydroquinate synthase
MYQKIHWNSTEVDQMLAYLRHDKKNSEGNIQFTMIETIGNCHINYAVDEADITAFLHKHALDDQA